MSSALVEMGTSHVFWGTTSDKPPPPPPPGQGFIRKPPPPRARKESSRYDSSRRTSIESAMSSVSEMSKSAGSEDGEGGASSSSLLMSRVLLSIVASLALWGTSLSVVNRVVYSENVLPLPALADVYRSAIAFINATQKESDDYKTCVVSALGNCNRTLQSQVNSELQWVQGVLDINGERVILARQYEGNCSHMWWSTLEAVIYWQENRLLIDDDPEDAFTDACTREERDYLLVRAHTLAPYLESACMIVARGPSRVCLMSPQKSAGTVNESLKDDAYGIIRGFTGYSSELVSDLSAQIRARKRYDDEYLANKTRAIQETNARNAEKLRALQAELDTLGLNITLDIDGYLLSLNTSEFLSCNTLAGGACPNISMRAEVEAMRQSLKDQYAEAEIAYAYAVGEMRDKANEKLEEAQEGYQSLKEEAQGAVDTATFLGTAINEVCGNSGSCESLDFDFTSPDLSGLPALDINGDLVGYDWNVAAVSFADVGIDGSLPDLPNITTLDDIQGLVQASADAYDQALREAINATNALNAANALSAANMRDSLAGIVPSVDALDGFDDYNPPAVELGAADNHDGEVGVFLNDSRSSLEDIGGAEDEPDATEAEMPDSGGFNISGDSLKKIAKPDFSFLNPMQCQAGEACSPPVEVDWLVDQVSFVISLLTSLDIIVRILKQLAYLRKIWGRSGLQLDPIDMQVDLQSKSAGQKRFSAFQGTALLVTHPYVISAGVMLVGLVGLYYAHTVYTPFFTAYEVGCSNEVAGIEKKTGTVLSNQAFVIAHTFAAREGNQIRVDGLNQEEATRMRTCDTYRAQTLPIQTFLEGNITQLNMTHHKSGQGVRLMRKCYDRSVVVPPASRYPPLAESLGIAPPNGACEIDFATLELGDGIFSGRNPAECDDPDECNQCQALLPCALRPVDGPCLSSCHGCLGNGALCPGQ